MALCGRGTGRAVHARPATWNLSGRAYRHLHAFEGIAADTPALLWRRCNRAGLISLFFVVVKPCFFFFRGVRT